jgi:hypothetical protein
LNLTLSCRVQGEHGRHVVCWLMLKERAPHNDQAVNSQLLGFLSRRCDVY